MTLEELLEIKYILTNDFYKYINDVGLENIKSVDLDQIIKHSQGDIINIVGFDFIYNTISAAEKNKAMNETNRVMKTWTKIIGYLTIAMTLMTLINLYLLICE